MNILILGGNGFIGSAVLTRLLQDGHRITALGRNIESAAARMPDIRWTKADLARMTDPGDWQALLATHDIVVNCAGALQDGLRDNLAATQERAMLALYEAASLAGGRRIIQISARLDGAGADLPFLATKKRADAALAASGLDFTILRPAIVIGRNAHGGTALLRALASTPGLVALIHAGSPVETVALDDVAEVVAQAVEGALSRRDITLAAPSRLTLADSIRIHRSWLGLSPAPLFELPPWSARPLIALADLAGKLGWRSPMRSTAMSVMNEGVTGGETDGPSFRLKTLQQTLAAHPAGVQDLWFARLYLLKAPIILILSLFWLLSGLIPLVDPARAAAHFAPILPPAGALITLYLTCALDIVLGCAVLVRPWARHALLGMLGLTAAYLATASVVEPALWLDPLGPLVKVLPTVVLTLVALAILDER